LSSTLQRGEGPPPNALQAVMAGWGPGNLQVFFSLSLWILFSPPEYWFRKYGFCWYLVMAGWGPWQLAGLFLFLTLSSCISWFLFFLSLLFDVIQA
jgi:hypothetical protein